MPSRLWAPARSRRLVASTGPRLAALLLAAFASGCLPSAPPEDPEVITPVARPAEPDTLHAATTDVRRGRLHHARARLGRLLDAQVPSPLPPPDRPTASFLLGWVESALGDHDAASRAFDPVRSDPAHPLSELAEWRFAAAALAANRPQQALDSCDRYLAAHPDGAWGFDCRLVRGRAYLALGRTDRAVAELRGLAELEEDPQRREGAKLVLADALHAAGEVESAADLLVGLYLEHSLVTTGEQAEARLLRLAPERLDSLSPEELYRRAVTLREAGLHEDSHALYRQLLADASSPALRRTLRAERHRFLWRNRQYEALVQHHTARHKESHAGARGAEHAYWAVQGASRAGLWDEAIAMQLHGMQAHGAHRRFRGSEERLALLYLGAGRYAEAREAFQQWQERSRRAANEARVDFMIAYSAYRAGDLVRARRQLETLAADGGWGGKRARYYLGKVLGQLGDEAGRDREWDRLLRDHGDSWYAHVVRSRRREPGAGTFERDGRWPEPPSPQPDGLQLVRYTPTATEAPPPWLESRFLTYDEADRAWSAFVEEAAPGWPELAEARELSRVGLAQRSAPLARSVYEDVIALRKDRRRTARLAEAWEAAGRPSSDREGARASIALAMTSTAERWTKVMAGAGEPSLVAAFATEWIDFDSLDITDPRDRAAFSLAYPAAHGAAVWTAAEKDGVDPLLILAIMKAESSFRHDAVSRVGARGLVQVMPSTASKVAALAGMEEFRVDDLTSPGPNLAVGSWYLGRLLERFGPGAYPLAVGSYNGGPHNIGRWLRPKEGIDFEDFVEEIPFDETRRYVKKVVRYYGRYVAIYGDGAPLAIPEHTTDDDPKIIDF